MEHIMVGAVHGVAEEGSKGKEAWILFRAEDFSGHVSCNPCWAPLVAFNHLPHPRSGMLRVPFTHSTMAYAAFGWISNCRDFKTVKQKIRPNAPYGFPGFIYLRPPLRTSHRIPWNSQQKRFRWRIIKEVRSEKFEWRLRCDHQVSGILNLLRWWLIIFYRRKDHLMVHCVSFHL